MVMDLANILTFSNILFSAIGVIVGIVFGALPGLTATMGVALFVPFTFGMDVTSAMAMLLGIYVAGIYGGSISAVLIKTPGTPSSAATVLDGYPLVMKGKAQEALSLVTIASFLGGVFSAIMLIVVAPQLAKIALDFGPPEYFAVALFGLAMVANLSTQDFLKGILAALFGILMSTIGIDGLSGTMRFTFGNINMAAGMELISTLIGLFALSEVFEKLESTAQVGILGDIKKITGGKVISLEILKILKQNIFNIIRSGIIGTIVGIVPATGTSIGSWLSYNEAKRASKHPEKFGKGAFEGIIASEAGNNAVTGGALVPLLTLGVPGDVVTAVMLGALMLQGLTPGPMLFKEHPDVVTGIYTMLIVSNIFMLIFGLLGSSLFVKIIKIPNCILMPIVLMLCVVGSYAMKSNLFDVQMALLFGVVGYLCGKVSIPTPPILLGFILGPLVEYNFRRAMTISQGSLLIFLIKPLSLIFILLAILSFVWPLLSQYLKKRKRVLQSDE